MRFCQSCVIFAALTIVTACGPVATPQVVPDLSRGQTLTAAAQPTRPAVGPSPTATMTSTPYLRTTDDPALDLSTALVKVGAETITLGKFRARVRYERFKALNGARLIAELLGPSQLNFAEQQGNNPALNQLAAIFNTLSNSDNFGTQIFDIMVRESILRQAFADRQLTFPEARLLDYWRVQFELQTDPNWQSKINGMIDQWAQVSSVYAQISRADLDEIARSSYIAFTLQPLIVKELAVRPQILTFKVKRVIAKSQADAETAYDALQKGTPFREVACRYSIDPAALGNGGALGFVSRGGLIAGLQGADQVFAASPSTVVGPLVSPLGVHLFKVNSKRQNADGDTQVDLQMITVSTATLADSLKARVAAGESFAALACQYSLDQTGGNGGDYGFMGDQQLPPEVYFALSNAKEKGLLAPIPTPTGVEVVLFEDLKLDLPDPKQTDQANLALFIKWQTDRAKSDYVTTLSEIWKANIPRDPLPRDVSPLLVEANFGLPTPVPTAPPSPTP